MGTVHGEVVVVNNCFHCEKHIPYIELKPLLVQLSPVTPCPLHMAPSEVRASVFAAAVTVIVKN